MQTIIGIDPGVTGAIAALFPDGKITIVDLPTVKTDGFKGIAPMELWSILNNIVNDPSFKISENHLVYPQSVTAYCEKSVLPPGDGKLAVRSMYDCRGVIRTALAYCSIPLRYVPPQTWKKYHGIPKQPNAKEAKEYSRGLALQLRPDLAESLKRKKDHNRAEAVLIAMYGANREK